MYTLDTLLKSRFKNILANEELITHSTSNLRKVLVVAILLKSGNIVHPVILTFERYLFPPYN